MRQNGVMLELKSPQGLSSGSYRYTGEEGSESKSVPTAGENSPHLTHLQRPHGSLAAITQGKCQRGDSSEQGEGPWTWGTPRGAGSGQWLSCRASQRSFCRSACDCARSWSLWSGLQGQSAWVQRSVTSMLSDKGQVAHPFSTSASRSVKRAFNNTFFLALL